jgi:hypothetical protein
MSRFLLSKRGCPFCNDSVRVINRMNLKLPIDKQIRILDCADWEEFGVMNIPLIKTFSRMGFDSYPFLYIDGIVFEPSPTPEQLNILLSKMLGEDFII